ERSLDVGDLLVAERVLERHLARVAERPDLTVDRPAEVPPLLNHLAPAVHAGDQKRDPADPEGQLRRNPHRDSRSPPGSGESMYQVWQDRQGCVLVPVPPQRGSAVNRGLRSPGRRRGKVIAIGMRMMRNSVPRIVLACASVTALAGRSCTSSLGTSRP